MWCVQLKPHAISLDNSKWFIPSVTNKWNWDFKISVTSHVDKSEPYILDQLLTSLLNETKSKEKGEKII